MWFLWGCQLKLKKIQDVKLFGKELRFLFSAVRTLIGWFPLSIGGLLWGLAAVWVLVEWGGNRYDYILLVVGGVAVGVLGVVVLCVLLGAVVVWLSLKKIPEAEPVSLATGIKTKTPFVVPLPWWVPLVQVNWQWKTPAAEVEIIGKTEWVSFKRRGEWESIIRTISIQDSFGLCLIRFVFQQDCMLRVLPNIGNFRGAQLVQGLSSGPAFSHPAGESVGDRIDIRTYTKGDPMRYILWKVYARTGNLVVRTPEKALQPEDRTIAFLISHPADPSAAGAAMSAIDSNFLGKEWKFGTDGAPVPTTDRETAIDMIVRSAVSSASNAESLSRFIHEATNSMFRKLLVFTPPVEGEWVERVVSASKTANIVVVLCIDGIERGQAFWTWRKHILQASENNLLSIPKSSEFDKLLQKLHASNIEVLVADRSSGAVVSAHVFARLAS